MPLKREEDISTLTDTKYLRSKRSGRKGNITRVENYLATLSTTPISSLDIGELERQAEVVHENIELFEAIQARIAAIDETSILDAEAPGLEEQRRSNQSICQSIQGKIRAYHVYSRGVDLVEQTEDFIAVGDYTTVAAMSNLAALKTKGAEFRRDSLAYQHLSEIKDLRDSLRSQLKQLDQQVSDAASSASPKLAPASIDTTSTMAPTPPSRLKLDLPTFSGKSLEWHDFWRLFSSVIEKEKISDAEKLCHLVKAMQDREASDIATRISASTNSYEEAVMALKRRYNQPRMLFPQYVHALMAPRKVGNNRKELHRLIEDWELYQRGMKQCGAYSADHICAALMEDCMTDQIKALWRTYSGDILDPPTTDQVVGFLERQLTALPEEDDKNYTLHPPRKPKGQAMRVDDRHQAQCTVCKEGSHPLFQCHTFKEWDQSHQHTHVRTSNLCYNCLSKSHSSKDCPSKWSCRECGGRHHTLLHRHINSGQSRTLANPQPTSSVPAETASSSRVQSPNPTAVLCTALAEVSVRCFYQTARILLDTGSTISLISSRVANDLRASRIPHKLNIDGMGGGMVSSHFVEIKLSPAHGNDGNKDYLITKCHVVDHIPPISNCHDVSHWKNLPCLRDKTPLADPDFGGPGRIDILLGLADVGFCYRGEYVQSEDRSVNVIRTIFGWTVGGVVTPTVTSAIALRVSHQDTKTDQLLQRLLEQEEIPQETDKLSLPEQSAEDQFNDSVIRLSDGRFSVSLPYVDPKPELGESRSVALKRFTQNERSLRRRGQWEAFSDVLSEYEQLGHAEKVPLQDLDKPPNCTYYLPMHGVVKETSTTTKLRIVFDASARTSNGVSLNDCLLPGPCLYPALSSTITKFRRHRIGMSSDISKMFREVALNKTERDNHRFLRRDETGVIQDWRMLRLTFGVTSSPYLASKVLRRLAKLHCDEFPEAAHVVLHSFYVDDCLTGADTIEEALHLQQQLCALLSKGQMTLRKWRTNSAALLSSIPDELREKTQLQLTDPSSHLKTLGVHWDTDQDVFYISVPNLVDESTPTKRQLASAVAKVFDVLGWFAPTTLQSKILLQHLWQKHIGWDEPIPEDINQQWQTWRRSVHLLAKHPIPRRFSSSDSPAREIQLHGFSDASTVGYGAVIYLRTLHQDTSISVTLIAARTRVATLKPTTVPRLELCGALLTAKLLKSIATNLNIETQHIYAWCDSSIVLGWLSRVHTKWKVYVSNRVTEIRELVPAKQWRYVPTHQNPGDHASRGLSPEALLKMRLWWEGPPWLSSTPDCWPSPLYTIPAELPESSSVVLAIQPTVLNNLLTRYSSFSMLLKTYAWCKRFISRARCQETCTDAQLAVEELTSAKMQLLLLSQKETFPDAHQLLKLGKAIPRSSSLFSLNPLLDQDDLIRVGGRLQKAQLPYGMTHPIILHHSSNVVKLFVRQLHQDSGHSGPSTLLALIAEDFHIIGVKRLVKAISHSCVVCQKAYARTLHQQMGQLPLVRTQMTPPFSHSGVDFAGPFKIKRGNPRNPTIIKCYICLFICMSTKAIHLELCMDLSTETFLAAFSRFVNRRGLPSDMYSDNGTNFIGASRELDDINRLLQSNSFSQKCSGHATDRNIHWHFSPPRTPHFGGLWESGVRIMKQTLSKILPPHTLTEDEFNTVLIDVEATLNSRPILPIDSTSTDGATALTPGHFLVGRPLRALPVRVDLDTQPTLLKCWNRVKRLCADIWKVWHSRYVQSLQARSKWNSATRSLQPGDVVLLKDDSLMSRHWPLALVLKAYPGEDNLVRVVEVRCQGKIYKRAINRLVLLV